MTDDNTGVSISRRQTLATLGTVGAAGALGGAATNALLWDEEKFGNASDPNVLQAGELDLKVDWEGTYYNWKENPTFSSDGEVDQPGPIINLEDVKPGDVLETTLSAHVYDNPAFLGWHYQEHSDTDNGVTEPEDKVNGHSPDDSDGDPFAAGIFGLGLLGAPGLSALRSRFETDASEATAEDDDLTLGTKSRKTAYAAGSAGAGIAAASASASAEEKPIDDDPDGDNDVNIDNGTLEVNVGELSSGTGIGSSNWFFNGTGTLYRETYGFQDGNADPVNAEQDGSVDSVFQSSVTPGDTATATITFPSVATANGGTSTLEVDRMVTLDPNEATLRVEYEVENTGNASFDNLQISQYVDYDIDAPGGEVGEYFLDTTSECEFIFQEDTGLGLFAGFTGESLSANHDLDFWSTTLSKYQSGTYDNDDIYPVTGTADVGLAFEWDLGALAPGETTTFRNSFVYNEEEADFEEEICQESPGGEPPAEDDGELDDVMNCVIWHDDGDNLPEEIWTGDAAVDDDDNGELDSDLESYVREIANAQSPEDVVDTESEQVIFAGTLAELDQNISRVMLDANDAVAGTVAEQFPDSTCYQNSVTEYIGVLCWVPEDISGVNDNIIQSDRLEFQFGFDAIQCRHNVSSDGTPIDGNITQADAENNANTP